jgi:hypothetical protein
VLAFFGGNGNDIITAGLVIAVGAVLRGLWTLQQKVSRLEGIDEMRERYLAKDRENSDVVRPGQDHPYDQEKEH